MAEYLAVTSRGLIDVLALEVEALGFPIIKKGMAGVSFDTDWAGCYRANLELRTATRILMPMADFIANNPEELYSGIKKLDFSEYINLKDTFAIDASVRESEFRDQRFVALKVKDAVADKFTEKFGERPNVDTKNPTLEIMVKIVRNQVSVAIDTSGETLSMRGYRQEAGEAPLREHLGAGLVMLSGWQEDQSIVDPMCGSGTILIEAG
jgi:23S rRNA G2445 N2-methylase RlmL